MLCVLDAQQPVIDALDIGGIDVLAELAQRSGVSGRELDWTPPDFEQSALAVEFSSDSAA